MNYPAASRSGLPLARALVVEPKLLVADEAVSMLDPSEQALGANGSTRFSVPPTPEPGGVLAPRSTFPDAINSRGTADA